MCNHDNIPNIFHSYTLSSDIDECSERNGGCMSLCINSPGSFTCACEIGFTLQLDGRSCLGKCDLTINIMEVNEK